jgi:uncharacterized membrane protein
MSIKILLQPRILLAAIFLALVLGLVFVQPPEMALAQSTEQACEAIGGCGGAEGDLQRTIEVIVNIFSIIVAIVAVIMIIWGGFKYVTSGGDSGNITAAKNTIIYAIVGLVIVALAQFLVQFVLDTVIDSDESGDEESSLLQRPHV